MAALDKIVEDLYGFLKVKWWGIPLLALGLALTIAFAVWNSLPNTVKERLLSSSAVAPPTAASAALEPASNPYGTASSSQMRKEDFPKLPESLAATNSASMANLGAPAVPGKQAAVRLVQPEERVSVSGSHGFLCYLKVDRGEADIRFSTLVKYCQLPLTKIPADRLWDEAALTGIQDTAFVWKEGRVALYSQPLDRVIFEFKDSYDGIRTEYGYKPNGSSLELSSYYFKVRVGKKWGVLNNDGSPFIPPKYDYIGLLKRDPRRFWTVRIGELWGMLDESGQELLAVKYESVDPQYPVAENPSEFTVKVKLNGRSIIVNEQGVEVGSWKD